MRRKYAVLPSKFALTWSILLFTAAPRSLFQSLETVSAEEYATMFFYFTIGVVAFGIAADLFVGRYFFAKSVRSN